jgi:hypothetical protein
MTRVLAIPAAASASLALHGGAALLLAVALAPKPVIPQKPAESRLAVEAYQVDRAEAAEAQPQSETAPEEQAQASQVASGEVPQSRAEPAVPPAERLASAAPPSQAAPAASLPAEAAQAAPPPSDAVQAAAPQSASLAPAAAPSERPAAVVPPATAAVAAPPPAAEVDAAAPQAVTAAPAEVEAIPLAPALGDAPVLAVTQPDLVAAAPAEAVPVAMPAVVADPVAAAPAPTSGQDLAAAIPDAPAAPQQTAEGAPAPSLTPPAEKGTATLAWAGPDGELDPKSLDAIQAFMQPGDVSAAAGEVRDGIEGLLASVPCSRLQVEFDPASGGLTLRGHVPEDGLRAPFLAALTEQIGSGIPVTQDLRILPRPQCGALSGIGDVGLPQSTELLGNPRVIGSDGFVSEQSYVAGEYINFTMQGLDYPAYVYVDYFFADGTVAHLVPNETVPIGVLEPGATFRIGTEDPGPGELALQVGPPYGQEIAVAFAASVPLYEGLRPLTEPADAYLAFLTERVAEARAATPDFKGEWVYFFISTAER